MGFLKFKKWIFVIFLIQHVFLVNSSGALKRPNFSNHKKVKSIKVGLKKYKKIISQTTLEISELEKNLNVGNKKYLTTIDKIKKIEKVAYQVQVDLKSLSVSLNQSLTQMKETLKGVLVNSFEGQGTPGELLVKKIMVKKITRERAEYLELVENNNNLKLRAEKIIFRLNEYKNIESELIDALQNLEISRRDKTDFYVGTIKEKDKLLSQLAQIKIKLDKNEKFKIKKKRGFAFKSPLKDFIKLEYNKRGVTFKYKGKKNILATKSGKIIYQGALSNFGNVIMIDHGRQTRTVLLGNFISTLKKGTLVKKGQILGYTRGGILKEEKLYFEVRKKNKVQNTFRLIERNSLAKNHHSNDNT